MDINKLRLGDLYCRGTGPYIYKVVSLLSPVGTSKYTECTSQVVGWLSFTELLKYWPLCPINNEPKYNSLEPIRRMMLGLRTVSSEKFYANLLSAQIYHNSVDAFSISPEGLIDTECETKVLESIKDGTKEPPCHCENLLIGHEKDCEYFEWFRQKESGVC